jgi:hypothetical protein
MWGCSNFVENKFRDDGLCQYAEPISELYFGELGDADRHSRDRKKETLVTHNRCSSGCDIIYGAKIAKLCFEV